MKSFSTHEGSKLKRQPVTVPKGYRKLDPTEKVEPGDEFYSTTFNGWYPARDAHIGHAARAILFRRPVEKEAPAPVEAEVAHEVAH